MVNDKGIENLNNYINILRARICGNIPSPSIVDLILETARECSCKVIDLDELFYIQKGEEPLAILHLNIDTQSDISFEIMDNDNEETIISKASINLISSAIIVNYLLLYSDLSFDVLISYSNIQTKIEDYREISSLIRTNNIINLNLRKSDALADEFSSLLLSLITVPVERFQPDYSYKTYRLSINNLMGGHAGDNINKIRKNSIKMIIGFFRKLKSKVDLEMISISGGDRYDNIPSYADLEFIINSEYANDLLNAFEIFKNEEIEKNLRYEPDMKFTCEEICEKNIGPITSESFNHLASFIELCPSGTFTVNSLDNQIISSSNLSTIRSLKSSINMILVFRSLTEEGMRQMLEKSTLASKISQSYLEEKVYISSWKNSDKGLTNVFVDAYKDLYDEELDVIKTQYSLDSSIVFKNLNVKIVSLGVKYKQDDQYFQTQIKDILRVVDLIENALQRLKENKERL